MIGKKEWFMYRHYGWGLAPKRWQGWVYFLSFAFLILAIEALELGGMTKLVLQVSLLVFFISDISHIMIQLNKLTDEKERFKELIIEKTISFAAITVVIAIIVYQTYQNGALIKVIPFDFSLLVVLGVLILSRLIVSLYVHGKND